MVQDPGPTQENPLLDASLGPGRIRMVEQGPRLRVESATGELVPRLLTVLMGTTVTQGYPSPESCATASPHLLELPDHYAFLDRDGTVVGGCGLVSSALRPKWMEVIYLVDGPHQGRGYAREGVGMLLDWAFRCTDGAGVFAFIEPTNLPSLRVARALGMAEAAAALAPAGGPCLCSDSRQVLGWFPGTMDHRAHLRFELSRAAWAGRA